MTRRLKLFTGLLASTFAVGAGAAAVASAASPPTLTLSSPTSVTNSSAVVRATIHPGGATTYFVIQSGLTTTYGVQSKAIGVSGRLASSTVAFKLVGLLPGTAYHYRFFLINKYGNTTSADHQVKTTGAPPAGAETGAATVASSSSAFVSGVVSPKGAATTYYFQYGSDGASVMFDTQTSPKTIPSKAHPSTVAAFIAGLAQNTSYHYRLVAVHSGSIVSEGEYQHFTTFPNPRPGPALHTGITPRSIHGAPYAFAMFGHLAGFPSPAAVACTGYINIHVRLGRKLVASELIPVGADCKFSTVVQLNKLPGHGRRGRTVHLAARLSFQGNKYLAPVASRPYRLALS
jgi:phosphodiesterase/alkaline phosphatase D-like protein